ncbi:MAG: peptidase S10 [Acidobacteria bacterium]|nr:peptidase S10 [Acidobacteriota bacterium]MBI3425367.1 peptidase S10 [Acidobacteriota bacterium]
MNRAVAVTITLLLTVCLAQAQVDPAQRGGRGRGAEQQPPTSPPTAPGQPAQARPAPPLEEKTSITHGSARIGGQQLNYTATAATYIIKADDGTPKATFFFVAYTKDEVTDKTRRPLSFVYNGGPGSASSYTHMGLGPKRIALTDDGFGMPAPYLIVENGDSFLDATDMVFIDAISTGYSRPAPGENTAQFYGVEQDATFFADFIYQYLTRNERWASPKFLIGESYGTTRSAQLSYTLQRRHQIYLNGVVLLSAVGFGNWGADDRTIFFLPTLISSAWYHKLLPPDLQKLTAAEIAQQARQFAHGEYAAALEKGDELPAAEYQKVVKNLARFTGLAPKYLEQTNLRISPFRWFKELLRDKRLTVGRIDARFTGMDADAAGERDEYDPSLASYDGSYVAMFQDYVRRELKWSTDMYYTLSARVQPWDQGQPGGPAEALRSAMTQQGHLKLLVLCGYYDVATPYNGIEHTVSHMSLEPAIRKNASFAYYEAGHMMYIEKKSREKLHKDVTAFINGAAKVEAASGGQ